LRLAVLRCVRPLYECPTIRPEPMRGTSAAKAFLVNLISTHPPDGALPDFAAAASSIPT